MINSVLVAGQVASVGSNMALEVMTPTDPVGAQGQANTVQDVTTWMSQVTVKEIASSESSWRRPAIL